ncbi:P270-related protein, partial [Trichomonas vaginalis G3]
MQIPDTIKASNYDPIFVALIFDHSIVSEQKIDNIIICAPPTISDFKDMNSDKNVKYSADQLINLSFKADVVEDDASKASPMYQINSQTPEPALLTKNDDGFDQFTIKAPSEIPNNQQITVKLSIKDPAGQKAEKALKIDVKQSPYITESPDNSEVKEAYKAEEPIIVIIQFKHFEERTGKFEYKFYEDQSYIPLPEKNVKEISSGSSTSSKKLLADDGKTYQLTIPAPKIDEIRDSEEAKLRIRTAQSDEQPPSNVFSKEIKLEKTKYVSGEQPNPTSSPSKGGLSGGQIVE